MEKIAAKHPYFTATPHSLRCRKIYQPHFVSFTATHGIQTIPA